METFTFIKRAFLTLTIALMSISGAMAATNWSGSVSAGTSYDAVTLTGNTTLTVSEGTTCTVNGNVTGAYKLTVTGGGKLLLLGSANNWTGGLDILDGTVQLGDATHAGTFSTTETTIHIPTYGQLHWYVLSGNYNAYCKMTGYGYLHKYGAGDLYFQRDMSGYVGAVNIIGGYLWFTASTDEVKCTLNALSGTTIGFFNGLTSAENINVNKAISGQGNIRVSNNTSSGAFNVNFKAACNLAGVTSIRGNGGLVCLAVENSTNYATSKIELLTANSEFVWRATGDYTLDIPITGAGNVQKVGGTGSLTMKKAQYSGYTSVLDGWVYFDNYAPSGNINFFGNTDASVGFTVDGTSSTITYSGAIISGGTNGGNVVSKQGTGTLILTSTGHTFTAKTEIYNGVLQVNGTLGTTSGVDLKSSLAVLRFNPLSALYKFDKVISGTGKVEKTGTAHDLCFTANNTYTGTTTISGGKLCIGDGTVTTGSSAGSIAGDVVVNGGCELWFSRSGYLTLNGVISGTGNILQYSIGGTRLGGVNTYTGTTYIRRGTLALTGAGSIAQSSAVYFDNVEDAIFDISAATASITTIKSLRSNDSGDAVILGTKTLNVAETGSYLYAGIISGSGGIQKTGTGTLSLAGTGMGAYTVTISAGTLEFSNAAVFGTDDDPLLFKGGTLKWASGNTADISSKIYSIDGSATFEVPAGTVQFNTAFPVLTSTASVTKTGAGQLNYFQKPKYTGVTNVNAGVLDIAGTAGEMPSATVNVASGAKLACSRSTTYTYSGVIAGAGKASNSNGVLVLSGANTFTGGLDVNSSTVRLSGTLSNSCNIAVASGATMEFNRSSAYTYSGAISGAGDVVQAGTNTLTLGGVNTYTGATTISGAGNLTLNAAGTIAASSGVSITNASGIFTISADKTIKGLSSTLSGAKAVLNGNLTIVQTGGDKTFAGVISGTGGLTKTGGELIINKGVISINTYDLTLSGANIYTGETVVETGTLILSGTIANSSAVTLSRSVIGITRIIAYGKLNVSSGAKTLKSLSAGYSGNEVILGSYTLTIGTSTTSNDGGGTFKGNFSGTGNVGKTGLGTFTLSGTASTTTGSFTLARGIMQTDGASWKGAFTQALNSTLEVNGTFNITGNITLNGGNIEMDLNAANPSKIVSTGSASVSTTNKTKMSVSAVAGTYTLISAKNGGLSGTHTSGFTFPTIAGLTLTPGSTASMLTLGVAVTDVVPPTAGTAVVAGTTTNSSVALTWGLGSDNVTPAANLHYSVYYSESNNITTVANCEQNGTLITSGVNISSCTATGLDPNTTYYFNVVVRDNASLKTAYTGVSKKTLPATLTGVPTISGNLVFGEVLTADASALASTPTIADLGTFSYQWKRDGANIGSATASTYTLAAADVGKKISVTVTASNTTGSVTSAETGLIDKAEQAAPGTPVLVSKTHNTITVQATAGYEYRIMDEMVFVLEQTGASFSGLTPNTIYHVYHRKAETATHKASDYNAYPGLSVTTDVEPLVTGITITPTSATVRKGQTQSFSASVTKVGNASTAVTWTIVGPHHASTTISTAGLLTVNAAETEDELTVRATSQFDANYYADAKVTVVEAPTITTTSLPGGTVGTQYSVSLTATGTEPITWTYSGTLPAGLTFTNGTIEGTPTTVGTSTITVKASNVAGDVTKTLTISITAAVIVPTITTTSLPGGTAGTAYSATLTATGTAPITWSATGLPAGLSINSSTGVISGTPSTAGTYNNVVITASNAAGGDSETFTISITTAAVVPTITTTTLPDGKVGTAYSAALAATGTAPITWSATGLPAGLTINASTGVISGTPATAGTYNNVAITATNGTGSNSKTLLITIAALSNNSYLSSLSISGVTLSPAFSYNVESYTASVPNNITSITVSYTLQDGGATVTVSGNTNLQVGANTVTITVTAEDGTTRTYTIIVTRNTATGNEALTTTRIYAADGTLYITLPAAEPVRIYSLSGRLVQTFAAPVGSSKLTLPRGVYVVKTASTTAKVAL